jgi:hypothetical protein
MTKETEVSNDGIVDLADLDTIAASDKGARIAILHPTTKEPFGLFIQLLGKHSTTFRELVKERINNRIKRESMAAKRGKTLDPRSAEEVEAEAIEMLAACTVGWETEIYEGEGKERKIKEIKPTMRFDKQDLPFNHQNAIIIYTRFLFIREQVDNAIGDLENFIQA